MDSSSNASNASGNGGDEDLSGDELSNDAEGVWSPDIEQSFQEALAIYPPCGRRKIILSDEGKMYGRNELIARYIKLRTGKLRSRKQVSSHIQVMARRKAKEIQAQLKDQASKDRALQALSSMSSAQIVSATAHTPGSMPPSNIGGKSPHSMQLPPVLYPHMSPLGPSYPPYASTCATVVQDKSTRDWVVHSMSAMSSAQIVSASAMQSKVTNNTPGSGPTAGNPKTVLSNLQQQPWSTSQDTTSSSRQPQHCNSSWLSGQITGSEMIKGGYFVRLRSEEFVPSVDSIKPQFASQSYVGKLADCKPQIIPALHQSEMLPAWQGRSIAGPRLRLVEFTAFLEQQLQPDTDAYNKHLFVHIGGNVGYTDPLLEAVDIRQIADKFPEKRGGLKELYDKGPQAAFFLVKFWADINVNVQNEANNFYGVTSLFESNSNMTIQYSTKVCSFGKQVVEKVETEVGHLENGRYVYPVHRSPMCDYMINFIHKLKQLPEKYMMNSVLENFTVLQVVVDHATQETLLCIAYVFEVSTSEHGAQHHIYRLVKD